MAEQLSTHQFKGAALSMAKMTVFWSVEENPLAGIKGLLSFWADLPAEYRELSGMIVDETDPYLFSAVSKHYRLTHL